MVLALTFGVFGLIVGSFLNVLVIRNGVRSISGRSACMACGRKLTWVDLLPVVSWLILAGKCRHCSARISMQYPLVEAAAAILFWLIGSAPLGIIPKIFFCGIAAILIAIAAYDFRHTIIPDTWAYLFAGLALLSQFLAPFIPDTSLSLLILAGPIAASPLFLLWLVSRGRWMGLGDAKLALGIGWLLGAMLGIMAVFFAFIIGALVSLPLVLFSSEAWKEFIGGFIQHHSWRTSGAGFTMKSEIPFGPFLILSCIIVWLCSIYGVDLQTILLLGSL